MYFFPHHNLSPLVALDYGKTNEPFNENEKKMLGLAVSDMLSNKQQSAQSDQQSKPPNH